MKTIIGNVGCVGVEWSWYGQYNNKRKKTTKNSSSNYKIVQAMAKYWSETNSSHLLKQSSSDILFSKTNGTKRKTIEPALEPDNRRPVKVN